MNYQINVLKYFLTNLTDRIIIKKITLMGKYKI